MMNSIETIGNLTVAGILLAPIVATGLRIAAERLIARRAPRPSAPKAAGHNWTDCYGVLTPEELYSAVEQPGHGALRPSPVPADVLAMCPSERPTMPASSVVVRSREGATVAGLDAVRVGNMRWNPGTRRWS